MRGATWVIPFLAVGVATCAAQSAQPAPASGNGSAKPVRVCAAESARSSIDWHLQPSEVLAALDRSLNELEQLGHRAGASGCDALGLAEDTLGVLRLALGGADIIFVPTMGGAVTTGDEEMNRAAFRTRAVDNFVYLVVAERGGGSMIISPQGKVLADGRTGDIAIAEIDPLGGREGGDTHNVQRDMRARLV